MYVRSETGKEGVGHATTQRRLPDLISRLASYEDTGLEPQEISTLCAMSERARMVDLLRLEEYQALGPIDHLRELAQAEKDGCLIVHGRWIKPSSRAWEHYCSVCRGPKPYFYGYGALDSSFLPPLRGEA